MKNIGFKALLAAMLVAAVCALTACGGEKPEETPDVPSTPSVSENETQPEAQPEAQPEESAIAAAYNNVVSLNILPAMIELNDNYVSSYYGITADMAEDKIFSISEDSLLGDTVIVVKAAAGTNTADIESIFTGINGQRMLELESYNPTQYARVEKATIQTIGSYVFYIVSDDNAAVIDTFKTALGL